MLRQLENLVEERLGVDDVTVDGRHVGPDHLRQLLDVMEGAAASASVHQPNNKNKTSVTHFDSHNSRLTNLNSSFVLITKNCK